MQNMYHVGTGTRDVPPSSAGTGQRNQRFTWEPWTRPETYPEDFQKKISWRNLMAVEVFVEQVK